MDDINDMLNGGKSVVLSVNYWLGVVTSVLIVFVGHRIKLPKIRAIGGGGGGRNLTSGQHFRYGKMTISNVPRFLGYSVNRETAYVTETRIYDPVTRKYEGPLLIWDVQQDNKVSNIEIRAGDVKGFFIYGVMDKRVHYYVGEDSEKIERSDTFVDLGQTRKLEIHIRDSVGRVHKINFKISAVEKRNTLGNVSVYVRSKKTNEERWTGIKTGFKEIYDALTKSGY